ncbi:MAG TPA: DHA2 family efflux MFS transporter permease subunit [Dermatophilaceae bacterium]|jgi:EmrB/QacA subfamily drug resistance transporter
MTLTAPPLAPPRVSRRAVPVGLALAAASLPMFMSTLDNLVMTSALPVIQHALSASVEQLQWMMNSYTLAFATLMLPAATLGDRWGRRRVFLIGIAIFTLASIGSALSTTTGALITARALQGVGGAAIMPLSLTLLAGAVPASRRAMAIGVWGGVSGLGVALGPVIGGAVVDGFSWQAIFWLNVPVAIVAIPLILRALPESHGRRQPLDLLGLALVGSGVLAAIWGIVRAGDLGWGSVPVAGALVAGVTLIAAFIRHEGRTAYPLVPLRLFRSRSFSVANVASLAFTLGMFGAVFLLAQYLQIVDGYTPLEAGIRTLPWTAAPMIVAPIAGLLAPRVGVRVLLGTGLTLQALGLAWLALAAGASTPYLDLVPGFILAGIGMGLTFAPSATAVLADMAPDDHATASSTNSTIREIGVALGVAVLVAVFRANGGTLTPDGYSAGLRSAVLTGAAVVALGALFTLWLPRTTARTPATAPAPGSAN